MTGLGVGARVEVPVYIGITGPGRQARGEVMHIRDWRTPPIAVRLDEGLVYYYDRENVRALDVVERLAELAL